MKYYIIILALLMCFGESCKKKTDEPPIKIINEVTASFVFSDTVVNLSEVGGETEMGCGLIGTFIYATTEGIEASFTTHGCAAGTYTDEFTCALATFRGDYTRGIGSNPGSITITKFDNGTMEGHFNIVAYNLHNELDSVKVSGSFKGESN